jgi:hypothetical protein
MPINVVFVVALASFYDGGMDAQGLAAAWQAYRDQAGSVNDVKYMQKEYEAALASRT